MNAVSNRLKKLHQLGQSPWYDNIDRRLIDSGELRALLDSGISGVTSNPTIFEKALNGSTVYDKKIKRLKEEGRKIGEIYDNLTADDVRDAADLLEAVHEKSGGLDGYVSIEVLPSYAEDPGKTVDYARRIFKKIGRRNVMVKVPGTKESSTAIRALIHEGIPVNVTLLFSAAQYERAVLAYQEGLRDRLREGLGLKDIVSVASIFVSRIDSKVDHILDAFAAREHDIETRDRINGLKGKIAVANAKFIYQRFKKLFDDEVFGDLRLRDGRAQRVVWASTSTKNQDYSDCLYVDNLIGPFTVNTMPPQTVAAFMDHGHLALTLESGLEEATASLSALEEFGVNLDKICDEAQRDGVAAFVHSFETMMRSLEAKIA